MSHDLSPALDALLDQICFALEEEPDLPTAGPVGTLLHYAQRADFLAARTEALLADEGRRGTAPYTALRLANIAAELGRHAVGLEELAHRFQGSTDLTEQPATLGDRVRHLPAPRDLGKPAERPDDHAQSEKKASR